MKVGRGTIVKSVAGHDKGDIQAVLSVNQGELMLSDGKRRKLEKPKRKNIKHVEITGSVLNENSFSSNRSLRNAINGYLATAEKCN